MITGLLIWRMAVKGQGLISKDPLKEMGILRPKPLECFLLLNIFHVASRLLYSVCLISDFISSTTLKEVLHDITFTISLASLAIYLIGLIYTIPRTHIAAQRAVTMSSEDRPSIWVLRPQMIDAFAFILFISLLVLNAFALISGYFIDKNNIKMAETWITIHYLGWSFFCWIIIFGILYFGKRLINIIEKHIQDTKGYGKVPSSKLRNLEHGLTKLRRIRVLLLGDLIFFAVASLVFGLCRNFILTYSPVLSLFLATCWVLIVPLTNAVIITILAYEINEKARMPTLRPKTTTTFNQSRSNDYSTAHSNMPPNYPSKPVRNNQKDHKGITINLELKVSDSKALEREQDFIDSVSQESSDSIELVVNPKHHQPSS
ncbi:AAA domain-containing protein [Gigaspora margarita]|nr:AAA domain-containing protein [Gigaspora margarita]